MNSARELADRLASLYRNERNAMADFLIALAAFDERKAWRDLGFPSLWAFLRHELKLSKSAAFHRKTAAELIQTHPAVAEASAPASSASRPSPSSRASSPRRTWRRSCRVSSGSRTGRPRRCPLRSALRRSSPPATW